MRLSFEISFLGHGFIAFHNDFHFVFLDDGSLLGGSFLSSGSLFGSGSFFGGDFFNDLFLGLAAGAVGQQVLGPGNDLFAVGGDDIDSADSGSQCSQNFQCSFHVGTSITYDF